jgi:uncharacterized Zn-binding protein involved in type VI secretion
MPKAARLGDPIGHSPAMSWLMKGLLIGAAVGIGAVLIAGTGGLAAVAVVGGLAAGGAGIGEALSGMSWAGKEVTGKILMPGSPDIFINGIPAAARAHIDFVLCSKHPTPPPPIAEGAATVYFNNQPAARVNDHTGCGAVITDGSPNVNIGGPTVQTDVINPENLVPGWVNAALLVVGLASAIVLAGPVVALVGLAGSIGGGAFGDWAGGEIFGQGSDGQKWMALGGSILGGAGAAKGGAWFDQNYAVSSEGLGSNLGNLRIQPRESGPPELPPFDGKTTQGVLITKEGQTVPLESGNTDPKYANYAAAGHVEGKAAIWMRDNDSEGGTVFHNNTNGTCNYCNTQIPTLLPEGSTLDVVPPDNAVANNQWAHADPTSYTGNANSPKVRP